MTAAVMSHLLNSMVTQKLCGEPEYYKMNSTWNDPVLKLCPNWTTSNYVPGRRIPMGPMGLFHAHCVHFNIHYSLLTFSPYFFVLFLPCCSHAQVFGRKLSHEFHIFYNHTEWNLLFQM